MQDRAWQDRSSAGEAVSAEHLSALNAVATGRISIHEHCGDWSFRAMVAAEVARRRPHCLPPLPDGAPPLGAGGAVDRHRGSSLEARQP